MFVNDIIYRPIELENTCTYEQKMWYEHENMTTKTKYMLFIVANPGHTFVSSVECKTYVKLQICSPPNSFYDTRELQPDKYNVFCFCIEIIINLSRYIIYSGSGTEHRFSAFSFKS